MLIVSQDRETIINFNNIVSIYVIRDVNSMEKGLEHYNIDFSTNYDINFVAGTYATEERAKEVLREIIGKYVCANNDYGYVENVVYEMPKE